MNEVTLKGDKGRTLGLSVANGMVDFRPSWACSDGRRVFTLDGAQRLLEAIPLTAEFDAWYAGQDAHGRAFAVKLVGKRLYADETPRDDFGDDDEDAAPDAPAFSWSQFERAVKPRAKTLKAEAS